MNRPDSVLYCVRMACPKQPRVVFIIQASDLSVAIVYCLKLREPVEYVEYVEYVYHDHIQVLSYTVHSQLKMRRKFLARFRNEEHLVLNEQHRSPRSRRMRITLRSEGQLTVQLKAAAAHVDKPSWNWRNKSCSDSG